MSPLPVDDGIIHYDSHDSVSRDVLLIDIVVDSVRPL